MPSRVSRTASLLLPLALGLLGPPLLSCSAHAPPPPHGADTAALAPLSRADFNRVAPRLNLPLFWAEDRDADGQLDPEELALVWGLPDGSVGRWVEGGVFTPAFREAYARVVAYAADPQLFLAGSSAEEAARREVLIRDLDQGRMSLVLSDFRQAPESEKAFVREMLEVGRLIDGLYARQIGSAPLMGQLPPEDTLSRFHFFLNQGPWCSAPATEGDPQCSGLSSHPARRSGLYPAALQEDPAFCAALERRPDGEALLDPFVVVTQASGGGLEGTPYHVAYAEQVREINAALLRAASHVDPTTEGPLRRYLEVAAGAFLDDNWPLADEAWVGMNGENSRYYVRVGPDEVQADPCSRKAGYHLSFALINPGSKRWQAELSPRREQMERAVAEVAGAPYQARPVSFQMPDFIDVILNAGDSRDARGATVGQSLPNWGPVANEGRGRTVAMANLYTDADSKVMAVAQVAAMFCPETAGLYSPDPALDLTSTVLHEAGHNLGPSHQYEVGGKVDTEVFGGPMASMLEELKAQTMAMFFTEWLVGQGVLDRRVADQTQLASLAWVMGQISDGLYSAEGEIKPYSVLSAIQLGVLVREGALSWRADALAGNGEDRGCFAVDLARLPAAVQTLSREAFGIKARGDVAHAQALMAAYVDEKGPWSQQLAIIQERLRRFPSASFLYSVRM